MDDSKPWYQSKTIWGAAIAGLSFILNLFHVNIGDLTSPLVDAIVGLVGVVVAIIGRVTATKQIAASGTAARIANNARLRSFLAVLLILSVFAANQLVLTSCANYDAAVSSVKSGVQSVQSWLADPNNQAEIQSIASDVLSLITVFGKHSQTTDATVVGSVAKKHPTAPAGAITAIAANPNAYLKK